MNSSSSRQTEIQRSQDQIKQEIARLQSQLIPESSDDTIVSQPKSPKRTAPEPVTLAPATPSPKKKRKLDHHPSTKPLARPVFQTATRQNASRELSGATTAKVEQFKKAAPSNLLANLTSMSRKTDPCERVETAARSVGFTDKPKELHEEFSGEYTDRKRDERLALVENLEPGPYEHTPPHDDPDFERLEPHSGINLTSRLVPHEEFQDYLRGRYYLSPSRLYSAIRLLPDKQGYDVPVAGDFVTIAVVAERGSIKFTRAPVKIEAEEGDEKDKRKQWKGKAKEEPERPSGKKFVNIKLIDFGARSGASSSATGGASVIRGDAFLTLLLFEADGFDAIPREDGGKPQKVYRGGSKGAFEHLTDIKEGDVIALLNPKILKPFQRSSDSPHPVNNVLAVTPESASSIIVLGRSRDLGMCTVRKQDGKVCGSWCDKRVSDVCDYHIQSAVQRRRAARPEFSVGTGGMSLNPTHKRKHAYDPLRQWGLKPEDSSTNANATYMISGHIIPGGSSDPRSMYVTESMGREGQAKARRKFAGKDADQALKALLERDKEGMRAVMKAREAGRSERSADVKGGKKKEKKGLESEKKKKRSKDVGSDSEELGADAGYARDQASLRTAYSAGVIKSLGFDPSMKPGQRKKETTGVKDKLQALEAIRAARNHIDLRPKPGPRIRSGVTAPIQVVEAVQAVPIGTIAAKTQDLDDAGNLSDDEFPDNPIQVDVAMVEKSVENIDKMVDLDDW